MSLLPICIVVLITSRMKCFMCGGGGGCPKSGGGGCDCLMTFMAIALLFFIFRATGVLDKIFYRLGYTKASLRLAGDVTQCTRNDTEYYDDDATNALLRRVIDMRTLGDVYDQTDEQYSENVTVDPSTMLPLEDSANYTETSTTYKTINNDDKDAKTSAGLSSPFTLIDTVLQKLVNDKVDVNELGSYVESHTIEEHKTTVKKRKPVKSTKNEDSASSTDETSKDEITTVLYYLVA